MNEFYKQNKAFTTTMAREAGITKKQLKADSAIVPLGTFPVKNKSGNPTMEKVYAYSPPLAELVRRGNRLAKRGAAKSEETAEVVNKIETMVKEILGFNNETGEREDGEESSTRKNGDGTESGSEESTSTETSEESSEIG
jgi:hypothetical protein